MEFSGTAPLKLDIFFGFPSYGGNGGIASEVPAIRQWWAEIYHHIQSDPRIGKVYERTVNDTPCPMVRNRFVQEARAVGAHVLVMIDSDQDPGLHAGEPWYKPFFPTAFDHLHANYHQGPHVLFAPYCGPPPNENVYVFEWKAPHSGHGDETAFHLGQVPREQADQLGGIQEAAAGPTGLVMYDLRCFDLLEPPYFRYEYTDEFETHKASTEDVVNLRDLALAGYDRLGYNPVLCCWDSWIGHHKPYVVGKPQKVGVDLVSKTLRRAMDRNHDPRMRVQPVHLPAEVRQAIAARERIPVNTEVVDVQPAEAMEKASP